MIRYFILGLTLIFGSETCISQEVSNKVFPANVVKDWRILPDTIFRGSLSPDQRHYIDDMSYSDMFTLVSEDGSEKNILRLDEIHPEDAAWIEFASTWVELSRDPERLPGPEDVEIWTESIERQLFPRIQFESLRSEVSGLPYFFACYASWWDKTGFLISPRGEEKGKAAQWAFDFSMEYLGDSSDRLRQLGRLDHTILSLLQKGYGKNMALSRATVPWVDASILHHYSNSNDFLLLQIELSRSDIISDRFFVAIAAAYKSGTVDFLYDGRMTRAKLTPVTDSTTLPGLVPGAMELVITDREDAGRFLQSSTVRVFVNPTKLNPLLVFRPYRTSGITEAAETRYIIPPPPLEGFDESSIAGLRKAIEAPLVLKKRAPFEFKDEHLPAPIEFQQKRTFESREWTSSGGRKMVAAYTGKLGGFPIVKSIINRDGNEIEIAHDQLSPFDRTYLTMMNADAGAGPTEKNGRILYRLSKPGKEIPQWLEVKFSDEGVVAKMQTGSAFFVTDETIPDSREALIERGSDFFLINWSSMLFRNLTREPSKEPTGFFELLDITRVQMKNGKGSELEARLSNGSPSENIGLPVRELDLPEAFSEDGPGGQFHIEYSSLRIPSLTGFWREFPSKSDSSFAKQVEPVKGVFQSFHRLGFVPIELNYVHPISPELSFHLEVEEISLSSEPPAGLKSE